MNATEASPRLEAMLREMLERQRQWDARLEVLEMSMSRLTPTSKHVASDTVSMAKLKTPANIGWTVRNEPTPLPPLVTPARSKVRSGGVIQTPPPRRVAPAPFSDPTPMPQVQFREPSQTQLTPVVETSPNAPRECECSEEANDRIAKLEALLAESERRRRASEESLARQQEQALNLENQLRQSHRLETVGRFVAGIAHDFNNLLTLICGNAELIRDGLTEAEPHREHADQVVAAGRSAAGLTRQLLALARPTAIEPRVLDLNCAIRGAEKMLRRLIGESLEVIVNLAPGVELVNADPVQVEQALFNLAANAKDAIGCSGGSVVIRTANAIVEPGRPGWPADLPCGPYVALTVSDTGCGMSDDVKDRVFEPFFSTKDDRGTGLGLANVRETMRLAGGHVEIESTVGWGTSVRLFWPRVVTATVDSREQAPITAMPSKMLGRGETVLVVEDDRQVRDLLRITLQQAGYRVLEAPNADLAEERVRLYAGPIALMIADIGLPGRDGLTLTASLRATRPDLRVLYISGYAAPESLDECFLAKPYTPQQMLEAVRGLIGATIQD